MKVALFHSEQFKNLDQYRILEAWGSLDECGYNRGGGGTKYVIN